MRARRAAAYAACSRGAGSASVRSAQPDEMKFLNTSDPGVVERFSVARGAFWAACSGELAMLYCRAEPGAVAQNRTLSRRIQRGSGASPGRDRREHHDENDRRDNHRNAEQQCEQLFAGHVPEDTYSAGDNCTTTGR